MVNVKRRKKLMAVKGREGYICDSGLYWELIHSYFRRHTSANKIEIIKNKIDYIFGIVDIKFENEQ